MPSAHTIPVNLPKDNETKEQFLTRSGKILMKTGKSKLEAQQIAESIWDKNINQDVRFTPFNAGQNVRWANNKHLGAAPPPIHMTQQGRINDANRASSAGRMPQGGGKLPGGLGDIGLGKLADTFSRNMNELIKGQQQLIEQARQSNEYLETLVEETRTIRAHGHKIRSIRPATSPPRSQDIWSMDKGLNIGLLKNPNIVKILPPELVKPLRVLDLILNPVQASHQFVERKVKGITGKLSDMLNGPTLTGYQKDPKKLARDAGVKVLDRGDLSHKVMTKILPEKLEEITDLQREQLDVLRNIYGVSKDNYETTTGKQHGYQNTVGAKDRVFDPATGMYMDKKRFEVELKKRNKMISTHLDKVKKGSIGGLLSMGISGLSNSKLAKSMGIKGVGDNFDVTEQLEKFNEKAFGTRRDLSGKSLTKLATKSTYNNEGVNDDLERHFRKQLRMSREIDNYRGGDTLSQNVNSFLNAGKHVRYGSQPERPANRDFDPRLMMAGPGGPDPVRMLQQPMKNPYAIDALMTSGKSKGTGVSGWQPPGTPGGIDGVGSMSGSFIQSVQLVGVEEALLALLERKGGIPVKVLPNPLPVLTEGSLSPNDDRDKQARTRKRKKMRDESKVTWHHSGIESVGGPAYQDNINTVLQKGEKIIAKGKAIKMDVATASTAQSTAELVEIEKRRPSLSFEVAKGLKIAADEGYGVGGGSGLNGKKRTLGQELKEVESGRAKQVEASYKTSDLSKKDRMIKLLEEVRDKKAGGEKKEEEEGFLSKLLKGGLAALLPLLAPLLGGLAAGGALALGINALADKVGLTFTTIQNGLEAIIGIASKIASKLGLGEGPGVIKKVMNLAKGGSEASKIASTAAKVGETTATAAEAATKASSMGKVAGKGAQAAEWSKAMVATGEAGTKSLSTWEKATNSLSKMAGAAKTAVVESKAGKFVSNIVKTVKGGFDFVAEALGGVMKSASAVFTKVSTFYNGLKQIKGVRLLLKGIEGVLKLIGEGLVKLLTSKVLLWAFKTLGCIEAFYSFGQLVAGVVKGDDALLLLFKAARVVIKILNWKILKAMYVAAGTPSAGVSLLWMAAVMGMDYLIDWAIEFLENDGKGKTEGELDSQSMPQDVIDKMNVKPESISVGDVQSEIPKEFAELDPGQAKDQKKASGFSVDSIKDKISSFKLPWMHSGGIADINGLDLSRLSSDGKFMQAAGYVNQGPGENSDNLNRTLQRGEYVMTKGETISLSRTMEKIKGLTDLMQKDVAEISIDLHRLRKYADEAEKRREEDEDNEIAGFGKSGGSSGSGNASKQGSFGAKTGKMTFGEQGGRGNVSQSLGKSEMSQLQTLRDRGDLGALTELGETGSLKGKIDTVSDGMGGADKGGVSYGLYQFSSKTGGLDALIQAGLNSDDEKHQRFAKRLQSVKGDATSNNGRFAQTWKSLANEDPEAFKSFQEKGFSKNWYTPVVEGLKKRGIDVDKRSHAFKSMIWSISAQHGPAGALKVLDAAWGKDAGKMTDSDLISKAYDERYATGEDGKMKYFGNSKLYKGLQARHKREKSLALGLLQGETATDTAQKFATAPNQSTGTMNPSDYGLTGMPENMSSDDFAGARGAAGDEASQFYSPVQNRDITSGFGPRKVTGGSSNHRAIDIKYADGEQVAAMSNGMVSKVGKNYVELNQADGNTTQYMHIRPGRFKLNDMVQAGQPLGSIVTEGTGSHLHLQVRDESGQAINPEKYLENRYQEAGMNYSPTYQGAASNKYKPGGKASPSGYVPKNAVYTEYNDTPGTISPAYASGSYTSSYSGGSGSGQATVNNSAIAQDEMISDYLSGTNAPNSHFQSGLSSMAMGSTSTTMGMMNSSAAMQGGRQLPPGVLGRLDQSRLENGYQLASLSTVESSENISQRRKEQDNPQQPIVLPPQQIPLNLNTNSNKASMAQMQDRKIDLTSATMIEKIFQNTIVSFMTLVTDFAIGNKSTTVFKNSF